MSARTCANPACGADMSDMREGALVCRRKPCRDWRDRSWCFKPYSGTIRGHTHGVGKCQRCGAYCLPTGDRGPDRGPLVAPFLHRGEDSFQLRTRTADDPRPEYAPRDEDFIKRDGTRLYEDSHKFLTLNQREWLDLRAPWSIRGVWFERTSRHMAPACRSGLTFGDGLGSHISHAGGPSEEHINFGRQRGARWEFERWLATDLHESAAPIVPSRRRSPSPAIAAGRLNRRLKAKAITVDFAEPDELGMAA